MKSKQFWVKASIILLSTLLLSISFEFVPSTSAQSGVYFSIGYGWISGTLDSIITVPSGSISPGERQDLSISLLANKMTINVDIPNVGSASVQVDALGSSEVPIPGLEYNLGLGKLGLYLTFQGSIFGDLSADGNASLTSSSLTWTTSGSKSVTLSIPQQTVEGTAITLTLDNITYHITAGVKAEGDLLGMHKEISIFDNLELDSLVGSPQSVSGTFTVKSSVDLVVVALWIVSSALIGLCVFSGLLLFKAKKKLKSNLTSTSSNITRFCGDCGTSNSKSAIFCKKCGKKFS